jgi:hypothetical protein
MPKSTAFVNQKRLSKKDIAGKILLKTRLIRDF